MARIVALILAVVVATSGSGLPMCVSLLARAAEPCTMHQHKRGSHDVHGAQISAAHDTDHACHAPGDVGCASGGSCPTSGTASPLAAQPVPSAPGLGRDVASTIDGALHSFLSPPLPPPPQA